MGQRDGERVRRPRGHGGGRGRRSRRRRAGRRARRRHRRRGRRRGRRAGPRPSAAADTDHPARLSGSSVRQEDRGYRRPVATLAQAPISFRIF